MGSHGKALSVAVAIAVAMGASATAATIYVNGVCGNNGWSGVNPTCQGPSGPKLTIQAAVNVANDGDEIVVAMATYLETIAIFEAITLRSSDPADPAVVAATIIDGNGAGPVITCEDVGPGTLINGLTIRSGVARDGGGLLNMSASPSILNCVFRGNTATDDGGAMRNNAASSPLVFGCTFIDNHAPTGAAMSNAASSHPLIIDCRFLQNQATANGGGLANFSGSTPLVAGSVFADNLAGGAVGAMFNVFPPTIANSVFCGNLPGDMTGGFVSGGGNSFAPTCAGQEGACCLSAGGCAMMTAATCLESGGLFQGSFLECILISCPPPACPADINRDGLIDTVDLVAVILAWNGSEPEADVDGSGVVDAADLVLVILAWGKC